MKKFAKIVTTAVLLAVMTATSISGTVSAKVIKGEEKDWFTWSYDTDEKIVRVVAVWGTNFPPDNHPAWAAFENERIGLTFEYAPYSQEKKTLTAVKEASLKGFSFRIDPNAKTLTITGTGVLPTLETIFYDDIYPYRDYTRTIILSNGITDISSDYNLNLLQPDHVSIGKNLQLGTWMLGAKESFSVAAGNPNFTLYDGALYSKDLTKLLRVPANKETLKFPEQVVEIGETANLSMRDLVLPWGITTIKTAIDVRAYPDTIQEYRLGRSRLRDSSFPYGNDKIQPYMESGYVGGDPYEKAKEVNYSTFYGITANSWKTFRGKKYYFDEGPSWNNKTEPRMVRGWKLIEDKWYYFDPISGILQTDTSNAPPKPVNPNNPGGNEKPTTPGDSTGAAAKPIAPDNVDGWKFYNNSYYYHVKNKALQSAWKQINGDWYYFNANGKMAVGFATVGGKKYYLDSAGRMVTGLQTIAGKAYYFTPNSGVMEHSKWKQTGGNWYYLNTYGAGMVKYWALSGGKWFYLGADGKMVTNDWVEWYGKWYYVGADGAMYTNGSTPDGRYVNASGVRIR